MTLPVGENPPLVAIVTPAYNAGPFLAETMEAVQAQTYPNLVHVVLDNASKDDTPDIIASFQNRKVPIITKRNESVLPLAANWSATADLIPKEAKYFSLLCADDTPLPNWTERLTALAMSDPSIAAVTSAMFWNDESPEFNFPASQSVFEPQEILPSYFRGEVIIDIRSNLYRTAELWGGQSPFWEEAATYTDLHAMMRTLRHGKLGYVNERIIRIRLHTASETQKEWKEHLYFPSFNFLLARHGAFAFGEKDFAQFYRRFRRHYMRRLMVWAVKEKAQNTFANQMKRLRDARIEPKSWEFGDALVDFFLKRAGLRPDWTIHPQ